MSNAYEPLTNDLLSGERVRNQTLAEGLKVVGKDLMDPESKGFLNNHAQYHVNLLNGFQVREILGAVPRAIGLTIMAVKAGSITGPLALGEVLYRAVLVQAFFMLRKISVGADGIGYATVWPYIHRTSRLTRETVDRNLKRIQEADYRMDVGLRLKDEASLREGVFAFQKLFADDKQVLPQDLSVDPTALSGEQLKDMAAKLWLYSRTESVPLPTKASHAIDKIANAWIGAAGSTALYLGASAQAYDTSLDPIQMLAKAAMTFGISYTGLKVAGKITPHILRGAKTAVEKCQAYFTAKTSDFEK